MDPFTVIVFGGLAGIFVALLLIGRFYPGSGADQLDWKPTRSPELEAQNEIDDLDQMLEAANARRRRRGEAELTVEGIEEQVGRDRAESIRRSEEYLAEQDIAEMLEAKNRRRREKGLPEVTLEEYRREIQGG